MIVIASHNNRDSLLRLLHGIPKEIPTLIVDTCSGQSIQDLASGVRQFPNVSVDKTPERNYDTGAYVYAFRNHPAQDYLFMHDSLEVLDQSFYSQFTSAPKNAIVPWMGVTPFYQSYTDTHYGILTSIFKEKHPKESTPPYAVFGPIFYITHDNMKKIESSGGLNFLPLNKTDAQATEQIWALWAQNAGLDVRPLFTNWLDIFRNVTTPLFKKHLLGRQ